jgi:hypothetical protein
MWRSYLIVMGLTTWVITTVFLALTSYHLTAINNGLAEQIQILNKLRATEHQLRAIEVVRCSKVMDVNRVCEKVVKDFTKQLGLDFIQPSQLLTTAIVGRENARGGIGGGD